MRYTTFILMLLAFSLASAQPGMRGKGRHSGSPPHGAFMGDLKLTADQQKQFEKLSSDLEKKQIATRSKIQTSRVELRDLMNEDAPDQAKVEAKEAEVTKLQGDLKTSRTTFWFDVNKMLNADQQKEWKKMLKRREARGRFSRLRGMVGRFMGGLRQRWSQHDGPDEK